MGTVDRVTTLESNYVSISRKSGTDFFGSLARERTSGNFQTYARGA